MEYSRFPADTESSVRDNPEKQDTFIYMDTFRSQQPSPQSQQWLLVLLLALGLTMCFWLDLWLGGGLIGGDIYTYFMPQKSFYADSLKQGLIPLWNPLVGHGYPVVAESQTGLFYPPTMILYWLLDVNTAYNVNHLFHYILVFIATVAVARELGLSLTAGLFASLVFVYSWFPPRCCLEWAIITGAYLPICLWMLLRYQKTGKVLWLWGLSGCLTLQLLAGHFNLAFITQLTLFTWVVACFATDFFVSKTVETSAVSMFTKKAFWPGAAIACGILMASVQLVPTWVMKQNSQRETTSSTEFDPEYGHLPPEYISQIVLPWYWYTNPVDLDSRLGQMSFLSSKSGTNAVEAHLYFGILPLILAVSGVYFIRKEKVQLAGIDRRSLFILAGLGLFGLIYATGLLVPVMQHIPGFGFFRGPGRYGILTTLAVACWAGYGLDQFLGKFSPGLKRSIVPVLFILTVLDYGWVSQRITYAFMVAETPIPLREKSPVRAMLANQFPPARVFAPGPNLLTTTGVASTPVYLGLGPAEYFEPELIYPSRAESAGNQQAEPDQLHLQDDQLRWLQNAGVTHILSFAPPALNDRLVKLVWQGYDPFLNAAWGRKEPLYLSKIEGSRGRASWENSGDSDSNQENIRWLKYAPDSMTLEVTAATNNASQENSTLILTDLYDKDWVAFLDDQPIASDRYAGMFRSVSVPAGKHVLRWEYYPKSVSLGKWISIVFFTIWLISGLAFYSVVYRRNQLQRQKLSESKG
ncbi:MAG: hypothetical protein JKY95_16690 [Planctomycetaceae bacterium]|nr:hypothetical protein [Planctomycetaceae bacterium]